MNIGKIINNLRVDKRLTLEAVGDYVGVSKSTVKKWEDGFIENMKRDKIALLSEILEVSPVTFITGEITLLQPKMQTLTPTEQTLLTNYRELNQDGQTKASEYVSDLVQLGKYTNNIVEVPELRMVARSGHVVEKTDAEKIQIQKSLQNLGKPVTSDDDL